MSGAEAGLRRLAGAGALATFLLVGCDDGWPLDRMGQQFFGPAWWLLQGDDGDPQADDGDVLPPVTEPTFIDIGAELPGVTGRALAWGDYDSDGDLDLALAGASAGYPDYDPVSAVYGNDGGAFADIEAGLTPVMAGSLAWADYDNDGDLDLALAGETAMSLFYSDPVTSIYQNDGGTFADIGAGLEGYSSCSFAWGDCDNDGDLDLAAVGRAGGRGTSAVYRNDGAGLFTDLGVELLRYSRGCVVWGDYDNDGDLDLAMTGEDVSGLDWCYVEVYRNEGGGIFVDTESDLLAAYYCGLAWGDLDNDGDLDLAVASMTDYSGSLGQKVIEYDPAVRIYFCEGGGYGSFGELPGIHAYSLALGDYDDDGDLDLAVSGDPDGGYVPGAANIYRNGGGGTFTRAAADLADVFGSVAWGDYDSDGDLDIALAGYDWETGERVTKIYQSDGARSNRPPAAPGGLSAAAEGSDVTFSWGPANDPESPSEALSYNLRVGTAPGAEDVFCGMAGSASGLRRVPARGNAQKNLSWTLRGFGGGTYHWSVQAVDAGFAGSPWAPAETVEVTGPAVTVKTPDGGESWDIGSTHEINWTWAGEIPQVRIELFRNGAWEDIETSFANTGGYAWTVSGDPAADCLIRVSDASHGEPADVSDGPFTVNAFVDAGAGLPGSRYASVAWGDYDSDGDLDLALAGYDIDTAVYRNDGGALTKADAEFENVWMGTLAWGDYDADGDLDLAVGDERRTLIYRNCGGDVFYDLAVELQGAHYKALAWGDYDNDGDLDIAVSGGSTGTVYRNEGDGDFVDTLAGLASVRYGSLACGDYDNDGDLDIVLAGDEQNYDYVTRLYRNDGGTFAGIDPGLRGVARCSLGWGDYDSDGDLDLALAGRSRDSWIATELYRNEGGGVFTETGAQLVNVSSCSLAWGDCDNDGDLDLALAGSSWPHAVSKVYRNDGGSFTDTRADFEDVTYCAVAWADYDSDGDLDLTVGGYAGGAGYVTRIYRNLCAAPNAPPAAPGGLAASVDGNAVTFSWGAAADAETPQAGLSYNLRVGTTPGGDEAFSGAADASGLRLIPALGNAQKMLSWALEGLPPGTCYWSVQAIDSGLAGSPWASEETVTVP